MIVEVLVYSLIMEYNDLQALLNHYSTKKFNPKTEPCGTPRC